MANEVGKCNGAPSFVDETERSENRVDADRRVVRIRAERGVE